MKRRPPELPDDDEFSDENEKPSKSSKKREMLARQALGERLVELKVEHITKLALPDFLHNAIVEAKRMPSHGAKRRQLQYIGKLMRQVEIDPIEAALKKLGFPLSTKNKKR